ncbi:abortive infection family protein [Arachidicoccus sp.]|uniref:abortive infection family protein n=1 Tax=Arachidicoccus sp. TaxID=1872624 RepID=UPI003D259F70
MNRITDVTRRQIADEMTLKKLWYHGNQDEPTFLMRLINLKDLPSRDTRYTNAYDDIYQHMVNNIDWDIDWIYTDPRINLFYSNDDLYLRFLCETIHPRMRTNNEEVSVLLKIYNTYLQKDGFEIVPTGEISERPTFGGREIVAGGDLLHAKSDEIKKHFNTDYVNSKIKIMTQALNSDTDLAIGTAKELLETTCKSILKQKKVIIDSNWTLPQLLKETTNVLDFSPKDAADPHKAEKAIRQILGGIGSIVHGVSELRNSYGTGHGKDADFKGLETKYAKLIVGITSEVVVLYLAAIGEKAELIVV